MDALTLLLERQSTSSLKPPAPSGTALENILRAAVRVPDFLHLRPYEFIVCEGKGLDRLGAIWQEAAISGEQPTHVIERASRMPHRAPLVVVVVCKHRESDIVTAFEQHLSAGCAVMAMQMAAQAQGYGGIWRSGWFMSDRGVHERLGLMSEDRIVGFLYLGTPSPPLPPPPDASDWSQFVRRL